MSEQLSFDLQPWKLVADVTGQRGWHLIDTADDNGVLTVCGMRGKVVAIPATLIVRCDDCLSEADSRMG